MIIREAFSGKVVIYNELGQKMHASFIEKHFNLINIKTDNWPSGSYHVLINNEDGRSLSKKLVKI